MQELGFYDGEMIDPDAPVIRLHDRAYQFGDGVYEAWVLDHGHQVLRKEHLDRFERSARLVGIEPCYSRTHLETFSDRLRDQSGIQDGMVYFQWSRGWQLPRAHVVTQGVRPLLTGFIRSLPPRGTPRSLSVMFHPDERHHFCHIKTLNLLGSVLAINAAVKQGHDDAILVRDKGKKVVTEGTRSNVFAVKKGKVYTAPEGNLILSGITRAKILELCRALGIGVVEAFQTPEFFLKADEVFFTSATGPVPITRIGDKVLPTGPVFERLLKAYRDFLDSLT